MRHQAILVAFVGFFSLAAVAQGAREGEENPAFIPRAQMMSSDLSSVDLSGYDFLDPNNQVPDRPLELAVKYYDANRSRIANKRFVTVIDMRRHSSQKRMWIVDMVTGAVRSYYVAHGKGSDADADGYATKFSNVEGSLATSVGFYLTGTKYSGKNGVSMYLHGLEKTNSNAYERAIVMHGASYVNPGSVGRSWGCPAVPTKDISTLIPMLQKGSLLFVYYNQ